MVKKKKKALVLKLLITPRHTHTHHSSPAAPLPLFLSLKKNYGITDGGCNGWKYGGGVHVPSLNLVVGIPLCAEAFLTIDTRTNALKASSPVPMGDTGIYIHT